MHQHGLQHFKPNKFLTGWVGQDQLRRVGAIHDYCTFFLSATQMLRSVLLSLSLGLLLWSRACCFRWKKTQQNLLCWGWGGAGGEEGGWFPKLLFHTHEHTPWRRRRGGEEGVRGFHFLHRCFYFRARNSPCGSSESRAEQSRREHNQICSVALEREVWFNSQWGHGSAEPLSDSLHRAPAHWAHPGAGAAGQHLLRHRPADGGQGPVRQCHLPRHPSLQGGQPAESHVRLLHDLQPHHPLHPDPAFDAPGLAERPRLEEDPDRGVPERVPGVQARPAPGGPLRPPAGGDVRSGGSVRAVRRLLRLLVRRDDAGVARLHGDGALQGQCDGAVVRSGLLVSVSNTVVDYCVNLWGRFSESAWKLLCYCNQGRTQDVWGAGAKILKRAPAVHRGVWCSTSGQKVMMYYITFYSTIRAFFQAWFCAEWLNGR